jgi:hypothetical protein
MNPARAVILLAGAVASLVVFLLLCHPALRRAQFRNGRRFTLPQSALGATLVMTLFALLAALQP